ncbi:hypothetical protein [Marilutibacter maris]|uniref:hypothetical protein n=1 Tax=Marilutibacter maris TaxID=1605891 RepID=UPI00147960D4|nr:hypothetical protein [Lysobacter maris]
MVYDGLDRLTGTTSRMFGTATYAYDVLDNLSRVRSVPRQEGCWAGDVFRSH